MLLWSIKIALNILCFQYLSGYDRLMSVKSFIPSDLSQPATCIFHLPGRLANEFIIPYLSQLKKEEEMLIFSLSIKIFINAERNLNKAEVLNAIPEKYKRLICNKIIENTIWESAVLNNKKFAANFYSLFPLAGLIKSLYD